MIQVTFLKDYWDQGKLQIPAGREYTISEQGGIILILDGGFVDVYQLYGMKNRGMVTIKNLD
jgi:hypothetical protein